MAFDAITFLQYYNIPHVTEGYKHCRQGWVQVKCPFCIGNPGWHLGFDLKHDWWNCWRCGYHRTWDVVLSLLDNDQHEARKAILQFKGRPADRQKFKRAQRSKILELPNNIQSLTSSAKRYLKHRKFDPELLEVFWDLRSTGIIGKLRHRIFIPIYLEGQMVSWQCRDITGKSSLKYLAQDYSKEIISNKDTLYGIDQALGKACIIVEGVADVWRLGPGAVATFGIKYRPSQVKLLLDYFKEFHIFFDPDPQAKIQAKKLANDLSVLGGKCKVWTFDDCDPGDLPQKDADALVRQILGTGGY